jgi:hypothetical protein
MSVEDAIAYDPMTGVFTWLISPSIAVKAGDRAGTLNKHGYRYIRYAGACYRASRLAWFLTRGVWPDHLIDHINRCRSDDRICNLREATASQNNMNKTGWNRLGVKGVWRDEGRGRKSFCASIQVNGRTIYLGSFPEIYQAEAVRRIAAAALHGEFAR